MAKEQQNNQNIPQNVQERVSEQFSQSALDEALVGLSRLGSFSFLESVIDGIQNLNPERKARKKMFLVEEQKENERKELAEKIDLWLDILTNNESISEMVERSQSQAVATSDLLAKNQLVHGKGNC